jgi:hypothetical protein
MQISHWLVLTITNKFETTTSKVPSRGLVAKDVVAQAADSHGIILTPFAHVQLVHHKVHV